MAWTLGEETSVTTRLLVCRFLNVLHMLDVGAATGGLLVGDKIIPRNEVNRNTEESALDSISPCIEEFHARDLRQNVDQNGSHADLIYNRASRECFRSYFIMLQGGAEPG